MPVNNAVMLILPEDVALRLDQLTMTLLLKQNETREQLEQRATEEIPPEIHREAMDLAKSKGTSAANLFYKRYQQQRKLELKVSQSRKASRTSTTLRLLQYVLTLPNLEQILIAPPQQVTKKLTDTKPKKKLSAWEEILQKEHLI